MSEHASLFALERHHRGELLDPHIERCAECQAKVERMAADDRAFMAARPTLRSIGVHPNRWRKIIPILALAASILAIVIVLPDPDGTRSKGSSHVDLLVKRGGETFPFDEQPLRQGDTLMFRYTSERKHMLLAGVEASGNVSIFVPDAELEPGQNRIAPQGLELDGYSDSERVILLLSDEPLDASVIERVLMTQAKSDPLELPSFALDADQVSWVIRREPD